MTWLIDDLTLVMAVGLLVVGWEIISEGTRSYFRARSRAEHAIQNFEWPQVARYQIARLQAKQRICEGVQVLAVGMATVAVLIVTH